MYNSYRYIAVAFARLSTGYAGLAGIVLSRVQWAISLLVRPTLSLPITSATVPGVLAAASAASQGATGILRASLSLECALVHILRDTSCMASAISPTITDS